MFCPKCNAQMKDNAKFCPVCGMKIGLQPPAQQPPAQPPPQRPPMPDYIPAPAQYAPPPGRADKKSPVPMIALIAVLLIVLIGGGIGIYVFVLKGPPDPAVDAGAIKNPAKKSGDNSDLPLVTYTYLDKKPEAVIEFTAVDSLFPSNYRTMDSLIVFTGYSDYGALDVLIEVEVPGFTQVYKQKVTLGRQVTKLRILPPLVTGMIDLNSEKMAQLKYSVTDLESNKLLIQESKNIKLYSKFDIVWGDEENGDAYTDNILAWMTPDANEILSLKRDAIDYLSIISDGSISMFIGYQDYGFFDHIYLNTWVQAVAIQGAMSDFVKVRYNNSWFSMDSQQRVKLPADTLNAKSGLCIETALVMASALQSAGMHTMLLFPPGHAQVAVEAWPDTGEYFLIETTILPMPQTEDAWNYTVQYLTQEQWWGYISGEGELSSGPCYIVDCDLGAKLGIRAMSN